MNQKQLETLRKNNEESREFARSCISAALNVLLKKDRLEDITITRLCSVAGVSRVAFYRNYHKIEDVLVDKIILFAKRLASNIGTDVYDNWLLIFKEVEREREQFEILVKLGYEHKIHDVFMSMLPENEDNRTIQMMWLSLFYSMTVKWIKDKWPKKAEDAARIAYKYSKNLPLVTKME